MFRNPGNAFCVLWIKPRGQRDPIMVGHAARTIESVSYRYTMGRKRNDPTSPAAAAWGGRVLYAVPNDPNSTKETCDHIGRWRAVIAGPAIPPRNGSGCHSAASGYSHPLDVLPSCIG